MTQTLPTVSQETPPWLVGFAIAILVITISMTIDTVRDWWALLVYYCNRRGKRMEIIASATVICFVPQPPRMDDFDFVPGHMQRFSTFDYTDSLRRFLKDPAWTAEEVWAYITSDAEVVEELVRPMQLHSPGMEVSIKILICLSTIFKKRCVFEKADVEGAAGKLPFATLMRSKFMHAHGEEGNASVRMKLASDVVAFKPVLYNRWCRHLDNPKEFVTVAMAEAINQWELIEGVEACGGEVKYFSLVKAPEDAPLA